MTARRKRARPLPGLPGGALDAFVADSELQGHEFLAQYRRLRRRFHHMDQPHKERAIAAAAEILRGYPRIRQPHVRGLLGGNRVPTREAQRAICASLDRRLTLQDHRYENSAGAEREVEAWLLQELGPVPMTALDTDLKDQFALPNERYCARVLALRHPILQLNAALSLLLATAAGYKCHRITRELKGWESLDAWAAVSGLAHLIGEPGQLPTLLLAWLEADTAQLRLTEWQLIATGAARSADHLLEHSALADAIGRRFLRIPYPGRYQPARSKAAELKESTRRRRAASADPLADRLPELVVLADVRYEEVATIRAAFDASCRALGAPGAPDEAFFTVTLPRNDWDGNPLPGTRTHQFAVMRQAALEQRFGPVPGHLPRHPVEQYHLAYFGTFDPPDERNDLPLLKAYRAGLFVNPKTLSDTQERSLKAQLGPGVRLPNRKYQTLFLYGSGHDRELSDRAFKAGLVLIPITMVHLGIAIARAAARSGLLSGARIGETVQQYHDRDSIRRDEASGQYFFLARPKWRTETARFYIDEPTLASITAVIGVSKKNGLPLRSFVWPGAKDPAAHPYVYQLWGKALSPNAINEALRILFLGRRLSSHDLRRAFGRFAEDEGLGRRGIQATLHHEHPETTGPYTEPTDAMKARLAARLAERASVRFFPPEDGKGR